MAKNIEVFYLPSWGLEYGEATHFGWWHSLHIGPFLIFWGQVKDQADVCAKRGHDMHPRPISIHASPSDFDRLPVACARCGFDPILDTAITGFDDMARKGGAA